MFACAEHAADDERWMPLNVSMKETGGFGKKKKLPPPR